MVLGIPIRTQRKSGGFWSRLHHLEDEVKHDCVVGNLVDLGHPELPHQKDLYEIGWFMWPGIYVWILFV